VDLVRNMQKASGMLDIKGISDKIVDRAKILKSNDKSEMVIELKPEWLGNITINILSEKGLISVVITAPQNSKDLIDANKAELEAALKNSNLNIGSLQVSVGGNKNQNSDQKENNFVADYSPMNYDSFMEFMTDQRRLGRS